MGNYHIGVVISRLTITLCVVVMMLSVTAPTLAVDTDEEEAYDIIMEVKRDRERISLATIGYEKNGEYYIPLGAISDLIGFKADIDLKNKTAAGFFSTEENSFFIDVNKNSYTLKGETTQFNADQIIVSTQQYGIGDIYLTTELFNKIFPLDLILNPRKQTLEITTPRKLPFELSKARQSSRDKLLRKKEFRNLKNKNNIGDLPIIENDYKLFSLPALDFRSTTRFGGSIDGVSQNLNINGRQDLLKTEATYNLGFSQSSNDGLNFDSALVLLERKSYKEGDMPFGLELAQFGDVRPKPSRLISGLLSGRGILISSEPRKQVRDFDQVAIEGNAEPGWDVELYRGNELLAFQTVDGNGEYRFEDVTLNYDNTLIKTIFYGPEGQIREEEQTFSISDSLVKTGKTIFEASILDLNNDLIPTGDEAVNQPEGFAQNYRLKYGVSPMLSVFTSFTGTPTREGDYNYATIGANLSFKGVSGLAEVYKNFSGGTAYDFRAAGKFAGINTNLRASLYSDFESQEARFDDNRRTSRLGASFSAPLKLLFGNLGLRVNFDHQKYKNDPSQTQIDFSQNYSVRGVRFTNRQQLTYQDGERKFLNGTINANYRINEKFQLRSLLNYEVYPEKQLENAFAELRYKNHKKYTAAINVDRNFQNKTTRLGANASYDFDKFSLGVDTDWEKDEGFRAFLRASMSMAPYGANNDYIFSSKNLANRAGLNGSVFLDKNYNGAYDDGDEWIEEAQIDIGKRTTAPSDLNGIATYSGSSRDEYENITLNTDSLPDPYMVSTNIGYSGLLRPGTNTSVQFPVIETGVIDGFVEASEGPLSGVKIQLLKGNDMVDIQTTAFDGYYLFEFVEPGDYTLRIDPSYEEIRIPPKQILVTPENLFNYNIDFLISEQAEGAACIETDSDGRITQKCPTDSIQRGIDQPASLFLPTNPTVTDMRVALRPNSLRMVLDYNIAPNGYEILSAKEGNEITILLPATNWAVSRFWYSPVPKIFEKFSIEPQDNGDMKLILKAVNNDTMQLKQHEVLLPNGQYGHRVYFDLVE